jgi:hypothetical protein
MFNPDDITYMPPLEQQQRWLIGDGWLKPEDLDGTWGPKTLAAMISAYK